MNCKDFDISNNYSITIGIGHVLWEEGKQKEAMEWLYKGLAWSQYKLKNGSENS